MRGEIGRGCGSGGRIGKGWRGWDVQYKTLRRGNDTDRVPSS